ncbi:Syntaxin-1A [Tritrichomonas foetus]|uniref:Syntaxin-1A n=1 Tax=Tritrichomonas foetus TaxID=1144522 RepID=A0A1J4J8F9_9EUKA|nr:Syntaxin-1A [Tritrichomonas foetus]|eukprot:OHS95462.1 Syntaxin-1A [Tritrichomonas foetus]
MVDALEALRSRTPGIGPSPIEPTVSPNDPYSVFWNKHDRIQSKITEIDYAVGEITNLDEEIAQCTDQEQQAELRGQLNSKMSEISASGNSIRLDIEKLENEIESQAKDNPNSPDVRLMQNHVHHLLNNFAKTISNFQAIQSEIKKKFSSQVVRRLKIAGVNDIDEKQAEEMIQNNPEALNQNMFQLSGSAQSQTVANIYNTIASRHQDILEIEQRLNEVLDLFIQFSIVVHEQGHQIDNIQSNIASARDYVTKGVKQLEKAKEHQKSSRKCMWIFVIAGVVLLIIVILIAVLVPTLKKKD